MSHINNQNKDLYSIPGVEELNNDVAASVSGGSYQGGSDSTLR